MKKILLIFSFLLAGDSFACSCGGPHILRMDKGSEVVVLAKLRAKRTFYSFNKNKYIFEPIKVFKGADAAQVEVWTSKFEMSCGLRVNHDVPYVLFVYREDNKLKVDHCSSWPLTVNYYDYTHTFNEFYKLTGTDALKPDSKERVETEGLINGVRLD
jgi:hypothetical protein